MLVACHISISYVQALVRSTTSRFHLTQPQPSIARRSSIIVGRRARIAKKDDEKEQVGKMEDEDDKMITIPFNGLIGKEQGSLFDKPLDVYDPMKNTDDLPGTDGSDEKIAAIQARIQNRVEELKKAGEWGSEEVFGKDPLAKQPIWITMAMQLKVCKPFESVDELALTYILLLTTTIVLMAYLLVLRETFDTFIDWFVRTDFDADFNLFDSFKSPELL